MSRPVRAGFRVFEHPNSLIIYHIARWRVLEALEDNGN
jgi:hypothetical protein